MNRDDGAALLGTKIQGRTVSTSLYESRAHVGAGDNKRPGRYAKHPFPEPDGYQGKAPWWRLDRADEIKAWAASRPGQGARTDRPRSGD